MEDTLLKTCFIAATTLTGLLCGASFDQSIKQLPSRHRIGVKAFSAYAKAADLKNGVPFYAILGIGTALTSILSAILVWKFNSTANYASPLYLAALFAICHTICTTQAAPTYFGLKKVEDEAALAKLFNKFERIQTVRSFFIALNFIAFLWALTILI
jgi:hypothetical protein